MTSLAVIASIGMVESRGKPASCLMARGALPRKMVGGPAFCMTTLAVYRTRSLMIEAGWQPASCLVAGRALTVIMIQWLVLKVARLAILNINQGMVKNDQRPILWCMAGDTVKLEVFFRPILQVAKDAQPGSASVLPFDMTALASKQGVFSGQLKKGMTGSLAVLRKFNYLWIYRLLWEPGSAVLLLPHFAADLQQEQPVPQLEHRPFLTMHQPGLAAFGNYQVTLPVPS